MKDDFSPLCFEKSENLIRAKRLKYSDQHSWHYQVLRFT